MRATPLLKLILSLGFAAALALPAAAQEDAAAFRLGEGGWAPAAAAAEPGAASVSRLDPAVLRLRRLLAAGRFEEAQEEATAWLEANPGHAAEPDVLLARGDARVGRNDLWNSLYDYERLLSEHPGSDAYLEAVSRELAIAKLFVGGWKRKLLGLRILPLSGEGAELLVRVQERAPGGDLAEEAAVTLADHYFRRQEMAQAAVAYDLLLRNFPRTRHRQRAMLRQIQAGLAQFKGPDFDATGLLEAGERLRAYQEAYPAAARRLNAEALQQRIRASLARRSLANARWYERRGDRVAAAAMRRRLIADHPGTAAAQEAIATLRGAGLPLVEESP
ncbi:outer membrane protein assembly factor BamD [Phycisphaera mikurensis]|uniref:Outer membrane lipoprotein BamD-like domain-containing protein n=1 Tax=Phycisphaera mikurensis (strain NBRC 102666 / KCTC 22515 / FYK2301M01) TaxID=1142394 RepID=I0IHD2_PHYMF|nr:outer membrane protein assembly factor BamD [Phycisphaera mikurensis]MBB6440919.1 outer membrane protein assembly factor BamD (BamD/ComL family) [Phycisphaera mikurensis]BAM04670.1 hypothetical protein PSMK_25110 [Phycisphaera mikurensis NBRC 102666]